MEKHHEFTMEKIYHFNCGECSNWWSYAGFLENISSMTCPHCGYKTKIELKEGNMAISLIFLLRQILILVYYNHFINLLTICDIVVEKVK